MTVCCWTLSDSVCNGRRELSWQLDLLWAGPYAGGLYADIRRGVLGSGAGMRIKWPCTAVHAGVPLRASPLMGAMPHAHVKLI